MMPAVKVHINKIKSLGETKPISLSFQRIKASIPASLSPIMAQVSGWAYWGASKAFDRYSPLDQIDAGNVAGCNGDLVRIAFGVTAGREC